MKALSMMVEKENRDIDKNVFGSVWKVIKPYGTIKYEDLFSKYEMSRLTKCSANTFSCC